MARTFAPRTTKARQPRSDPGAWAAKTKLAFRFPGLSEPKKAPENIPETIISGGAG